MHARYAKLFPRAGQTSFLSATTAFSTTHQGTDPWIHDLHFVFQVLVAHRNGAGGRNNATLRGKRRRQPNAATCPSSIPLTTAPRGASSSFRAEADYNPISYRYGRGSRAHAAHHSYPPTSPALSVLVPFSLPLLLPPPNTPSLSTLSKLTTTFFPAPTCSTPLNPLPTKQDLKMRSAA